MMHFDIWCGREGSQHCCMLQHYTCPWLHSVAGWLTGLTVFVCYKSRHRLTFISNNNIINVISDGAATSTCQCCLFIKQKSKYLKIRRSFTWKQWLFRPELSRLHFTISISELIALIKLNYQGDHCTKRVKCIENVSKDWGKVTEIWENRFSWWGTVCNGLQSSGQSNWKNSCGEENQTWKQSRG